MQSPQISLRLLLLTTLLIGVSVGWLGINYRESEKQRVIAAKIEEVGGYVQWSTNSHPLGRIQGIGLFHADMTDISPIAELADLEILCLDSAQLKNAWPAFGLKKLRAIEVHRVTDATDLSDLAQFSGLRDVCFYNSQLTSLPSMTGLTQITLLSLHHTQVSDLSALADLENLRSLTVDHSPVSDLTPLAALQNLESVELTATRVQDLAPLSESKNLRELYLERSPVSDASPLANLHQLETLSLVGTNVTGEDAARIRRSLPKCVVIHRKSAAE